jgi:predicted TIM-barrel fold metal-dependent hydrolase
LLLAALGLLTACATTQAASIPVFDSHAHIEPPGGVGQINPQTPGTVTTLLSEMARAHVIRSLAMGTPVRDERLLASANDALLAQCGAHSQLIPVAALPSSDAPEALAELDRVAKEGFRVVKVIPSDDPAQLRALDALVARAARLKLVVLVDGWSLNLDGLAKIALAHPDARLVVAHLGGIRFSDALVFDMLRRYAFYARNVWFDLSNVAHVYARSPFAAQLVWVCRRLGTDRILFGSDFPLLSPSDAIADVQALGFTEAEQRQILHDNAAALFHPASARRQGRTEALP